MKGMAKGLVIQSDRQFSADMIEAAGKDYSLHVPGERAPRQLRARKFTERYRREGGTDPLR